jgi:hypothetical protein
MQYRAVNMPVLCVSTRPLCSRLPRSRHGLIARCRRCAALPAADPHRIQQRHPLHALSKVREDEVVRHLRFRFRRPLWIRFSSQSTRGLWQLTSSIHSRKQLTKGSDICLCCQCSPMGSRATWPPGPAALWCAARATCAGRLRPSSCRCHGSRGSATRGPQGHRECPRPCEPPGMGHT